MVIRVSQGRQYLKRLAPWLPDVVLYIAVTSGSSSIVADANT